MQTSSKKAFTMVELVFVIVVIGILAGIAIPKLAASRDDAEIVKAKATLASVRSAIATERQKRILRGAFSDLNITDLGDSTHAFSNFNGDSDYPVLRYPVKHCTNPGCWERASATSYKYHLPGGGTCDYTLTGKRLTGTCSEFGD